MTEHILVCIDGHPKSHLLVDAGFKKARETGLPWRLVFIEQGDEAVGCTERSKALLRLMDRAKARGASIIHQRAADSSRAILEYLKLCRKSAEKFSHIFVGQYRGGLSGILPRKTLAQKIANQFGLTSQVTIIPLEGKVGSIGFWDRFDLGQLTWRTIIAPLVAVSLAYLAAEAMLAMLPQILYKINTPNITLVFLLACVTVSLRFGVVAGLIASVASVGLINFAYIVPINKFNIGSTTDLISISIFLFAALVVAFLGGHVRAGAESAQRREQRTSALYEINKLTSEAQNKHQLMEILNRELSRLLHMEIAFFVCEAVRDESELLKGDVPDFVSYPADVSLSETDKRALEKCWRSEMTTGFGTLKGIGAFWYFEPISTVNNHYGVLAVNVPLNVRLDPGFSQLVSALADHAATALERVDAVSQMQESRFNEEREKLRSMLLSSVSHDLKTPLASIIGSMSVMKSLKKADRLSDVHFDTLTETSLDEAQRLDSFITNILSMTKLESGDIQFKQDLFDPMEPLGQVRKTLRTRLRGRDLTIEDASDSVLVRMDGMMTGQVLQNLIDNAAKYSPAGKAIDVLLERMDEGFVYRVRDHGAGIPDDQLERIFDKYERLNKADSQVAGTGLGLAISRAIMKAQGGKIWAENHKGGGAVFNLYFPEVTSKETGVSNE
ncbi:MAG: DUF4118 domain-containing protein [Alphaproteobacteria bacterium]|nr:DUF4118 domain-containing protein [Alphaproteobacteria bacterium]